MNHRLNVIGTLDLSAYGAEYANSRNTGMADLVASLQWVHDNIETFGGDPTNITIFGQSGAEARSRASCICPRPKAAYDAATGKILWHANLGAVMGNSPVTYQVDGKQYVLASAGDTFWAFYLQ